VIEFFENLFSQINPFTAYVFLFLSAYVENVVPPIPGDAVIVLGAYLVSNKQLDFIGVYLATTFGSLAGFVTMYYIGRKFGRSFIYHPSRSKLFKEKYIKRVEIWFGKWGYWVILANRFLAGSRSVISLFSGLFHLNAGLVVLLALVSALIWNALLITGGILLGKNWSIIINLISRYNQVLIVLTIILVSYFVFRKFYSRKKA
jgi:membrane protein DedA with SNARE-associated domain